MSQHSSRIPAAVLVVLTLCLLPVAAPADAAHAAGLAGTRVHVRPVQSQSAAPSLLDRLERLRAALWHDMVSLWGKAGARIDDNGKS